MRTRLSGGWIRAIVGFCCLAAALLLGPSPARAEGWSWTFADVAAPGPEGAIDYVVVAPGVRTILFAELEGDVFQTAGRGTGGHDSGEMEAAAAPGEDEGGGCAGEGGPGGFRLELYDESSVEPICFAERPKYPGWMRDPRLACALDASKPGAERYRLRVMLTGQGHGEEEPGGHAAAGELRPFRLTVNLVAASPVPRGKGQAKLLAPKR